MDLRALTSGGGEIEEHFPVRDATRHDVIAKTLRLIARLKVHPDGMCVWAANSMDCPCLLPTDRLGPYWVRISCGADYVIEYRLPDTESLSPDLWISARTASEDDAVQMIFAAIRQTRAFEPS